MNPHAAQYLSQLLAGASLTQAVAAAAELGIADRLAGGAMGTEALAQAIGCDFSSLLRLLRVLAALQIVVERAGAWQLAELGQLLRAGAPGSLREAALVAGAPWRAGAVDLAACVRSGRSLFERRFGVPLYRYLDEHPEAGAHFDAVQAASAAAIDPKALDLDGVTTLMDVGGGSGALLERILLHAPPLRGLLVERSATAVAAGERFAAAGLEDRARAVAGDFFDPLPAGADACLLAFVLHNWDDRSAARILARCAAALPPGGRLFVVENLLDPARLDPATALLDVEMLIFHEGGRERTEAEYRALLAASGFEWIGVTPATSAPHSSLRVLQAARVV